MRAHDMKLYVVQHGDAVQKDINPDRPLSEMGQTQIRRLAKLLKASGIVPSRIFHSGKLRAKQTAELIGAALVPRMATEAIAGLGPNDSSDTLISSLADGTEDALVVSHMPFVGRLVARLVGSAEGSEILAFQPGSMACLERGDDGDWVINWFLRPDIIA